MKNLFKVFGTIALVAVIGFSLAACGGGSTTPNTPGTGSGGTLTVTDIPAKYNGKYAEGGGADGKGTGNGFVGWESTQTLAPLRISNGRVSIPLWKVNDAKNGFVRFSDNGAFNVDVLIYDSVEDEDYKALAVFMSVNFSGGSASISWNNVTIVHE
jgi:hypothetical protein